MNLYDLPPEPDFRDDLSICPNQPDCGSELVYPVTWEEAESGTWQVLCRCPNCEWTGVGLHKGDKLDDWDDKLDDREETLYNLLDLLTWENMQADLERMKSEVEVFASALHDGLILPGDIGRIAVN